MKNLKFSLWKNISILWPLHKQELCICPVSVGGFRKLCGIKEIGDVEYSGARRTGGRRLKRGDCQQAPPNTEEQNDDFGNQMTVSG